jgi:hypothetical protein
VRNWLGQEISVGDVVYNARRSGNTTTIRLGRVIKFTKNQVRVAWCVIPARRFWDRENGVWLEPDTPWTVLGNSDTWNGISVGNNDVDNLVKVEDCEAAASVPPLDALV